MARPAERDRQQDYVLLTLRELVEKWLFSTVGGDEQNHRPVIATDVFELMYARGLSRKPLIRLRATSSPIELPSASATRPKPAASLFATKLWS